MVFLCNKVELKCLYRECVYPTAEWCTKCALLLGFNSEKEQFPVRLNTHEKKREPKLFQNINRKSIFCRKLKRWVRSFHICFKTYDYKPLYFNFINMKI